jgi:peptidoglycan/LPS O-acetylase OafA/YrhL
MKPLHRLPLIDAAKGIACIMIVWHHLAFYGPMSDVAGPLAPQLLDWLYEYGRMAVSVFLVVAGFLAASTLAPNGAAVFGQPGMLIWRRYERLVRPYLVALLASMLAAALVHPWLNHSSVPAPPALPQLVAHVLLLQDLLGYEALSAGVWYVAIDFQLFAITVLVFSFARWAQRRWPACPEWMGAGIVVVLALVSLLCFNRVSSLDTTALYFVGSYGLGLLAFWATRVERPGRWIAAIGVLGALALLLEFRERIAVACVTAVGLAWASRQAWAAKWPRDVAPFAAILHVGRISYSVFLIHFPVCLLVNAALAHWWPTQPLANALGMFAAFGLSIAAGELLYRWVEAPAQPRRVSSLAALLGRVNRP